MADDTSAEIEHLLTEIGGSGCTFIRNGDRHSAEDAEDHLRIRRLESLQLAERGIDLLLRFLSNGAGVEQISGRTIHDSLGRRAADCPDDGDSRQDGFFRRQRRSTNQVTPGKMDKSSN